MMTNMATSPVIPLKIPEVKANRNRGKHDGLPVSRSSLTQSLRFRVNLRFIYVLKHATRDERVHHYLYLFDQLNYLHLCLCSDWARLQPEVSDADTLSRLD